MSTVRSADAAPAATVGIRTFAVACGDMPAHVARPAGEERAPCVIVIHERYGLVRHTREIAERFARDGYVAIAPNFFHRHPDQAALNRGEASCDISDPEALAALVAAVAALDAIPQADTSRLAAMGVCQTGRHPLLLAAARPIGAALVWYGAAQAREWAVNARYPRPLEEIIAAADCPVLGIFGETDHLIAIDDVRRFRDCLERHGKSFAISVFPDAPHGFLNDAMPGRYRRARAEAAWSEQRAFLDAAFAPGRDRSRRVSRYAADIAADYDFTRNVRME
jgi:carboxymethylenebutenolidase